MLSKFDDFPIHQTTEPLAVPVTSDRNVYDRTWFNGYSADGEYYFGVGIAVYPHRGVLDCAFSVVQRGQKQHCFFGSRRAPLERSEMQVGPFRLEIIEPMLRSRLTIDDNKTGLSCDLTFSARTSAIKEGRQSFWQGNRCFMDTTRFDQFGRWEGTIRHPGGEIKVDPLHCFGTKDRSWGVRPVGEPETGGAPLPPPEGLMFLWAPLFWEDHVSHAIFFDHPRGEPLIREGFVAPLYASEAGIPGVEDPAVEQMKTVEHRVRYVPGTRLAAEAEIDLVNLAGQTRTIVLEPLLRFQMKGLGYGNAAWRQGMWKGEMELGYESYDLATLDLMSNENRHVQQVVRATDGVRHGIGALEQAVMGPYFPHGFTTADQPA